MDGRISWEDERAHFGFYPVALAEDLTNVVLDCARPTRPPPRAKRRALSPTAVWSPAQICVLGWTPPSMH